MKIAYLVLAHDNPAHLARMIRALTSADARFYIHIDRKATLANFQHLAGPRVRFCADRVDGAWGDISLVDATLNLVKLVLADTDPPDYCVLLSGACYPVQPNGYIENLLADAAGTEFIQATRLPNPEYGKPIERLTRYYIRRNPPLAMYKWKLQSFLHRNLPARDYQTPLRGLELVAGSQWWALTPAALRQVVGFIDGHPQVYKFCRYMDCPDEFVFQLALWNSPFRERIGHCLTFTHWLPHKMGPEVLDASYLDRFRGPTVFDSERNNCPGDKREVVFARKFNAASGPTLDAIDALIAAKAARYATTPATPMPHRPARVPDAAAP